LDVKEEKELQSQEKMGTGRMMRENIEILE
jgi:hypothetical protein